MTTPIRYDKIYLYGRFGQAETREMRIWLDAHGILYRDMQYEDDTENLAALSTWFHDENDEQITFPQSPVVIWDSIIWEADDGSDSYEKRMYATQTSEFPSDFLELAVKVQ